MREPIALAGFGHTELTKGYTLPQFGIGHHDNLQYQFFAGDTIFVARLFDTPSLFHASIWVYAGALRELFNVSERLTANGNHQVDLESSSVAFRVHGKNGRIELHDGAAQPLLSIEFELRAVDCVEGSTGPIIHYPNVSARVQYEGSTYGAVGYAKRYWCDREVPHWGYRFVQGFTDDRSHVVWTGDATFNHAKHAYFKFWLPEMGRVVAAKLEDSVHRQNAVYAMVDGVEYVVSLEELAVWETNLKSDRMDSHMRQRVCRMQVQFDGKTLPGYAINETCFGTLG